MRVCNQPGCPELSSTPRCAEHTTEPWAGSTRRQELPHDWAAIRKRILTRDRHRCTQCGSTKRLEVDHIGDRHDHGDHNLRTLCHKCHNTHTQAQATQGRTR